MKTKKRTVLWMLWALWCFLWVYCIFSYGTIIFSLVFLTVMGMIACVNFWLYIDAKENSYALHRILRVGAVILPMVTVPYYLIRTRGWGVWVNFLYIFLGALSALFVLIIYLIAYISIYGC